MGQPHPGPYDCKYTNYLVELMDDLSPYSSIQVEVCLKSAQVGFTTAAESVIAFYMDAAPTTIMYASAKKELLEEWSRTRLDDLIDSCGFRHKISNQTSSMRSSGDTTYRKEYMGGNIKLASAQSGTDLRSSSRRLVVLDECDGAPPQLTSGEGNFIDVAMARTDAWGARKKILIFGTPTLMSTSQIYARYLEGDCRKYFVPCVFCGEMQELEFGDADTDYGLKAEIKDGQVARAFYQCKYCHGEIENDQKTWMIPRGEWRPTKEPKSPLYRSRHISSLYSPPGMLSWKELYQRWVAAQEDPNIMRSFVNLNMGMPYKEGGMKMELSDLTQKRGSYPRATAPKGSLFLTMAVDVQRGEKNPRLELEVVGHGLDFMTWSIDRQVFFGNTNNPFGGAWESMHQWAIGNHLTYYSLDGKHAFSVELALIDGRDGNMTEIIQQFIQARGWQKTSISMGERLVQTDKEKRERQGDKAGNLAEGRGYALARMGNGLSYYYRIGTVFYKHRMFRNFKVPRIGGPEEMGIIQNLGFCDFPVDSDPPYDDDFYLQFANEEEVGDHYEPVRKGRPVEAIDCRVYNLAAANIVIDALYKKGYENARYTDSLRASRENRLPISEEQFRSKFTVRYMLAQMYWNIYREQPPLSPVNISDEEVPV